MNNELLQNLDKLHTTLMGVDRIRRNLVFGEGIPDVVAWCKKSGSKSAYVSVGSNPLSNTFQRICNLCRIT